MTKAEALADLNLVFEDDEVTEKKSDAIAIVSTDLQFGAEVQSAGTKTFKKEAVTAAPNEAQTAAAPVAQIKAIPKKETVASVTKIQPKPQAVPVQQAPAQQPTSQPVPQPQTQSQIDLVEKMKKMEIEMQVKVQMAEFKTDILADLLSDIKLLEYQMGTLLNRMYTKHPDLKQEILMLKKYISDFSQKKRK